MNTNGNGRPDPLLITGMHNSGTSLLAEIIHEGGVFLGADMAHHESRFFSILVNDWLVMRGPENWAKLPLMDPEQVEACKESAGRFVLDNWLAEYMRRGYDGASPWGFKDPRLCVLLPMYLELFPEATVVHIRRDPDDVAASLCRRVKRGVGVKDDFGHWRDLTQAYADRVLDNADKCRRYCEISYESLCTDGKNTVLDLFDFLGVEFTDRIEEMLGGITTARIGSYERRLREAESAVS
jgi:hypothetical protein